MVENVIENNLPKKSMKGLLSLIPEGFISKDLLKLQRTILDLHDFHDTRLTQAKVQGENDGTDGQPVGKLANLCASEEKFLAQYNQDVALLAAIGEAELQGLQVEHKTLVNNRSRLSENLETERKRRLEYTENQKKLKLDEEEESFKTENAELHGQLQNIGRDFNEIRHHYEKLRDLLGENKEKIYIQSSVLYYLLLIVAGILEIPLNYTVFANFLLSNIETYLLSCLLVIIVPIVAHYWGQYLREDDQPKKNIILFWATVPIIFTLNILVGLQRAKYVYEILKVQQGLGDVITFIVLSLLVMTGAVIVSYLRHPRSKELYDALVKKEKAEIQYNELRKPIDHKLNILITNNGNAIRSIKEWYQKEIENIHLLIENIDDKIATTIAQHNKARALFMNLERVINHHCEETVQTYRHYNLINREKGSDSIEFADVPDLNQYFANRNDL